LGDDPVECSVGKVLNSKGSCKSVKNCDLNPDAKSCSSYEVSPPLDGPNCDAMISAYTNLILIGNQQVTEGLNESLALAGNMAGLFNIQSVPPRLDDIDEYEMLEIALADMDAQLEAGTFESLVFI